MSRPTPEVPARPTRRRFTAEYKRRILSEADACKTPGEIGALLRREGLYSSHLSSWRAARRAGTLAALSRKRGPKSTVSPEAKEAAALRRENARLRKKLERAETVIAVQKKLSALLGIELPESQESENDENA